MEFARLQTTILEHLVKQQVIVRLVNTVICELRNVSFNNLLVNYVHLKLNAHTGRFAILTLLVFKHALKNLLFLMAHEFQEISSLVMISLAKVAITSTQEITITA